MEMRDKVLIIEDDASICKFLKATLGANAYDVIVAEDGKNGLEMASSHCPDCILLDMGLPDIDGNDVITSIRKWSTVPIVVISARGSEDDKARALDLGADDYLTKPFGTTELLARIRTALRHAFARTADDPIVLTGQYCVGELVIDYRKRRVYVGGQDANLTPNEYRIIALLGRHSGQVITYRQIMRELWGPMVGSDNKLLRVHVTNIRRKIEPNPDEPQYIFTEVGVGYRIAENHDDDK